MDEQLMQPITNVNDTEQANVVFIPDATYRQLMTYPICVDEICDDFLDNPRGPTIIETGSKLGVFKEYLAFTHYHPCRELIPLQYELQSGERSSITIHGVGHIGPLRRCIMHQTYQYQYSLRSIISIGIQTQPSFIQHGWRTS